MATEREVLMVGVFVTWIALCLAVGATALYVVGHFISKFW